MDRERIRVAFERRTHILLERLLAQSSWTKAIEWAERWVVLGHSPEAAFRAMMVAHAGLGDIASVAATYRRCADTLTRDLGVEPSPLTRETFERLSRGGVPGTRASVATVPATEQTVEEGLRRLLASWRRAKADVLDLPHLAMLHAWPGESAMEAEDASLVLRSALHHGIDWEPWMRFASSDAARAGILRGYYETYPRPPVRLRIVDALRSLPRPSAQPALEKVLEADDAPEVSEAAALGLASLGAQEAAVAALRRRGAHGSDPAGVHALVAVADVMDRPVRVAFDTGVPLALLVGLRRWKSARREALRQAARAALGAGIASAANGLLSPWYASLGPGRGFQETLEFVSIPGWMIGGALGFLVIGGAQGLATALLVGAADACWRGNRRLALRVLLGGFSGLVHTGFLLLATSTAVAAPTSPASVYVPGFLLYGWILGASLSFVIPSLEARRGWKVQLIRAGWVAAFLGLFTLAFGAIVHVDEAVGELVRRVAFAVLLPIGLAIGASTRSNFALRDTPEVR
jgi:hypothetical protein